MPPLAGPWPGGSKDGRPGGTLPDRRWRHHTACRRVAGAVPLTVIRAGRCNPIAAPGRRRLAASGWIGFVNCRQGENVSVLTAGAVSSLLAGSRSGRSR